MDFIRQGENVAVVVGYAIFWDARNHWVHSTKTGRKWIDVYPAEAIELRPRVECRLGHGGALLGSTSIGNLRVSKDDRGLAVELALFDVYRHLLPRIWPTSAGPLGDSPFFYRGWSVRGLAMFDHEWPFRECALLEVLSVDLAKTPALKTSIATGWRPASLFESELRELEV